MSQINTVKDIYERETYRTIRQFKHILDIQSLNVGNVVSTDGTQLIWSVGSSGGGAWGSITGTLSAQTDLQSALNLKANLASPTFTGTVVLPSTTSIGTVSSTEIGYLDNVTSSIQTQLNAKLDTSSFVPAGSNTQVQFNNAGAFGASANLTYNGTVFAVTAQETITDTVSAGSGSLTGSALNIAQTWSTTGTPTAIKLNVTNSGSNAASQLIDLQVGGSSKFKVGLTGNVVIPNNGSFGNANTYIEITDNNRINYIAGSGSVAGQAHSFLSVSNSLGTSGETNYMRVLSNFSPTSGTGIFNSLGLLTTINQTGGANGITRGLYINPTLTAAADFRALEIATGQFRNAGNSAASYSSHLSTGTWFTGGSATTTKPHWLIEPTGTTSTAWSTSGTGLGVNAASGFTGNLIDLQSNGTSRIRVTAAGYLTLTGNIFVNTGGVGIIIDDSTIYRTNDTGLLGIYNGGAASSRFAMYGSAHATRPDAIVFSNASNTERLSINNSGLIQFGGTTSSFPALKRVTTGLQVRLADDSADTTITASNVISTATVRLKGYTVATLPTGVVGDLAYVTDALTPAFGVTIVGGGAVVTPVFYDGTTWTAR